MLKAEDNPPIIPPDAQSIRDFVGQWWVAHVKSRNEKALAHDLLRRGVSYFLPMSWKVRRQSGRTIRSLLPLFSGYLFFCGRENERIELLRTNRVANLIVVNDQETLIDELAQIENALRAGAPLIPHKYIKIGQRCRIIAGPLAGLTGIVVRAGNTARLLLQVDILGQAAAVEIDIDLIELLD
ncbi:MAG: UpxY family transcription antiterminator [Sedimentisphaerales bacterium]|nr:UpxY family transcription antiterminator [Sedimentisphaerales bacterium]